VIIHNLLEPFPNPERYEGFQK